MSTNDALHRYHPAISIGNLIALLAIIGTGLVTFTELRSRTEQNTAFIAEIRERLEVLEEVDSLKSRVARIETLQEGRSVLVNDYLSRRDTTEFRLRALERKLNMRNGPGSRGDEP